MKTIKLLPALLILIVVFYNTVNAQDTTQSKPSNSTDSSINNLTYEAQFPGGRAEWSKYLQRNLNTNLGKRYLVIPKGQTTAKAKVIVSFVISTSGEVTEAKVVKTEPENIQQIFLVEALRIIENSPKWIPGVQKGKLVKFRLEQPITWMVRDE